MNNIYLTSTELSWKEFIKYYIMTILAGTFFILLKMFNVIQIDDRNMNNVILSILYVLIIVQMISSRLNKCIIDEIRFRSESLITIIVPIFAAIGTRILTDILQFLPTKFGGNVIGIAKGQLDMSTYNPIESIFRGTVLGPYFEELLFRIVFFTSIAYVIGYLDTKFNSKFSLKVFFVGF
jgi:membrane protease YdiL (CAAX protease family)